MAKFEGIDVRGIPELKKVFDTLPKKLSNKVMIRVFREASKPLIKQARINTPKSSKAAFRTVHRHMIKGQVTTKTYMHKAGELKASIWHLLGRKMYGFNTLWIGPRKGVRKADGWYGHFIEFGTKGFTLKKPAFFGGMWHKKGTVVKDIIKHPYMRPAWDATRFKVIAIIRVGLRRVLEIYAREGNNMTIQYRR